MIALIVAVAVQAAPVVLVPLPPQPEGQAWPTESGWPTGTFAAGVDVKTVEAMVTAATGATDPVLGETRAVLVIQHGQLVYEKYKEGFTAETRQISWSMAKSITQALVGAAVLQGRIDIEKPMVNRHWKPEAPIAQIPWRNWLQMNDGQNYHELDPRGISLSDSARKLFGPGRLDVAGYCSELPLWKPVGTHWNYNSCGMVLLGDTLTDLIVPHPASPQERRTEMLKWMKESFFTPLGMNSATPEFDGKGLYYGSALIFATARDFARLGYLYLRDGMWDGKRLIPEGWADLARTGGQEDDDDMYGAGFWVTSVKQPMMPKDAFRAMGHEGQLVVIVPSKDLVVVRLGHFGDAGQNWDQLAEWMGKLIAAFPNLDTAK